MSVGKSGVYRLRPQSRCGSYPGFVTIYLK